MGTNEMMLDEAAHDLARRMAKHFIGETFAADDDACKKCVAMARQFLAEQYNRGREDAAAPPAALA